MSIGSGFDSLQTTVNVPPDALSEARRRRDLFRTHLVKESDVSEVRASGSLARGTHKDPINDVDVVVVFDEG
jgi:predicted nucleotidyltransferase